MFNFINGEVVSSENGMVVLLNNGIGFEIFVSASSQAKCEVGKNVQLFTFLQVKEDNVTLFGFADKQEKSMFIQLISVSGIGPKLAMTIMSGASAEEIATAIVSGNTNTLCSIKGLGKKTAERIILELKEKVAKTVIATSVSSLTKEMQQTVALLVSLGCSEEDAIRRVKSAFDQGFTSSEDLLKISLRMR